MSKYDTMTDEQIDKRIDGAHDAGYRRCIADVGALTDTEPSVWFGRLRPLQIARRTAASKDGKDATTGKKQ